MNKKAAISRGKILLIELSPSVPNLGRSIVMPRYGLLTIASILAEKTDYDVALWFEPYVGKLDVEKVVRENPRYIMVNGLTTSAPDNEVFLTRLRERMRYTVPVIAGGEHATMFPNDARRYADYIVLHEGDETVISLLSALEEMDAFERDRKLAEIPGLIYRDSHGAWRLNTTIRRVQKIDYRYDFSVVAESRNASPRFWLSQIPLQTSRGCKHYCSFCSWISLYGKAGYYTRPIEDVVHDISHTMEYTGFRSFMVVDNLFGGDIPYAEELLHQIVRRFEGRSSKPSFTVLCRADQFVGGKNVFSDEFMQLMKRAGVTHVSLGLESVNPESLAQMRKRSDIPQYLSAADRLHRHDFLIAATFVAGFDGDRYEDVLNIAEFAKAMGCFTIQVYARNITPGTLDDVRYKHRIIPGYLNKFFNGHTVNTFSSQMLPSTLQRAVFEAASLFYDRKEPQKRLVGRMYQQIWKGISSHYEALLRIEDEILLPQKLYVHDKLQEEELLSVVEDEQRRADMEEKIRAIFQSVSHAAG